MLIRIIVVIAVMFATSAYGQIAMHCCIQPPLTDADIAQRHAFEREMAGSPECKRMHIGCPEGMFTQEPVESTPGQFKAKCRAMSPSAPLQKRLEWLKSCEKEAP